MLDKLLGILSIALLVVFMGVVVWYIARPPLTIIVAVVILMAVYDFWRELWGTKKPRAGQPVAGGGSTE